MYAIKASIAISALSGLVAQVAAHGYLTGFKVNGVWTNGWTVLDYYASPAPIRAGWSTMALDSTSAPQDSHPPSGFVSPSSYQSPDIICHKSGAPGQAEVAVPAGSTIQLFWNTWPADSHRGPVLNYLASCGTTSNPGANCTAVDKTTLKFAKLSASGLKSGPAPGTWATDDLAANNNSWAVTIPQNLKTGSYVLRHEIIALHGAQSDNGAQNYPQCVNIKVTGKGSETVVGGESAEAFYKRTDPGILIDIYQNLNNYTIPGPAVEAF